MKYSHLVLVINRIFIAKSTLDRMCKIVKSNKDVFGFKW
ncbi:hypothetical protein RPATATE_0161 [Rickettsia parkeri str. Tate's Hell]|uniref:Transposase n=1 Tax=Rickettsia parkeri str. Tate's Hell TaxID=1359189 RepID=A0ABR5DPE4_RICPA|nr:hypothetical protein RPAAT24_0761 [Rickettsia parkeri str. AT\